MNAFRPNKRIAVSLIATAFLAACAQPPASPIAGPGNAPATAGEAAGLFATVCVANRGDLSNAPGTLATLPFTRNSSSNLYFHNQLDLSFALFPQGGTAICSLAYGSRDSVSANQQAILSAAPDARFSPPDDNRLFGASIRGAY